MSRSRRRRPFRGITTARSEKDDKRQGNRALRRVVRRKLRDADAEVLPDRREYLDPWAMAKDGKIRFDPRDDPRGLRK